MKRFIIALVATMMMIPSVSAYANEKIDVVVDGKTIVFDQNPVIENGRFVLEGVEALPKEKAAEAKHYILEGVRETRYK